MVEANRSVGAQPAYTAGVGTAVLASLLAVWTTIVRDDCTGAAHFMIVMALVAGAFTASFKPACMSRALTGVAAMQAALGLLTATAPVTATLPRGPQKMMVFTGVLGALWLAFVACFRRARNVIRANHTAGAAGT